MDYGRKAADHAEWVRTTLYQESERFPPSISTEEKMAPSQPNARKGIHSPTETAGDAIEFT